MVKQDGQMAIPTEIFILVKFVNKNCGSLTSKILGKILKEKNNKKLSHSSLPRLLHSWEIGVLKKQSLFFTLLEWLEAIGPVLFHTC